MCGRFASTASLPELGTLFSASTPTRTVEPSYNVAPSGEVYAIAAQRESKGHFVQVMRWGLRPNWSQPAPKPQMIINARLETVDEKPMFAEAFIHRRCIIPADGFYEWKGSGGKNERRPMYIYRPDGGLLLMAGAWERSRIDDTLSFVILTTKANSFMSNIHHRMPVTLSEAACDEWLSHENFDAQRLKELGVSESDSALGAHYVDPKVGNPRQQGVDLIAPVPAGTLWE